MANRNKLTNILNHRRQLAYLAEGIVMIPKLDPIFKLPKQPKKK